MSLYVNLQELKPSAGCIKSMCTLAVGQQQRSSFFYQTDDPIYKKKSIIIKEKMS
jgi:hypothetical protein